MWKLCFFALSFYVSCSYTWLEGEALSFAAKDLGCTIKQWSFGPLDCGLVLCDKLVLCVKDFTRKYNEECRNCLTLCVENKKSCKVDDPFYSSSQCLLMREPKRCSYFGLSTQPVNCTGSTIQVGIDDRGIIQPDFGQPSPYYTCAVDLCRFHKTCRNKPNAKCSIGYLGDCRPSFEGLEPKDCGCPSNQVYHDQEILCQKLCDNSPPRCEFMSGCGCRRYQFWDGAACVDQCGCPSGQVYFAEKVPCQKMCDNSPPKCQYRPKPGCGCRSDQFWNGLQCVDECDKCPLGIAQNLCDKDPCEDAVCLKYDSHKGLECKAHTCGGCHPKFYLNGNLISVEDCKDGCVKDYWVDCFTKDAFTCPVCYKGCVCKVKNADKEDKKRTGKTGCWKIWNCVL